MIYIWKCFQMDVKNQKIWYKNKNNFSKEKNMSLSDRIRINAGRKFAHSLFARFLIIGILIFTLAMINVNKQSPNHSKIEPNIQKIEYSYVAKL